MSRCYFLRLEREKFASVPLCWVLAQKSTAPLHRQRKSREMASGMCFPKMTFHTSRVTDETVLVASAFSAQCGEEKTVQVPHNWLLLGSGLVYSADCGAGWLGSNPDITNHQLCDFRLCNISGS